jgi:hypothetical protein
MLQRNSMAVGYCLNRAAEAGHLAALVTDQESKQSYLTLAESWLKLADSAEFVGKLDAHLSGGKP